MRTKQASISFNKREVIIPFFRVGVPPFTVDELTDILRAVRQK